MPSIVENISKINKAGWRFDNSYEGLPKTMLSRVRPIPVKKPKLIILNDSLSKELGLNFSFLNQELLASVFSGNLLPEGAAPIAQAYAGHQFGFFTILGDGRATLIGEHVTTNNSRVDIQLKGSGQTPYSRGGDGRAALGPVLREYIISEAMHALGIPTTRSLAVVTTGENVFRESPLPGAILTRVAASHIRVGTFQYVAMQGDLKLLRSLVSYTINRHYPKIKDSKNLALNLLKVVIKKQIELITNWMRVGFIHGVMNTDNMAVSGETIDYGPCAFMDFYNPKVVFSSIDSGGRYAFANQPLIAHWNLSRFAETLLPLIHKNKNDAIEIAKDSINDFTDIYNKSWLGMMRSKLGLFEKKKGDEVLIKNLLAWMEKNGVDYTNTFSSLVRKKPYESGPFQDKTFVSWYKKWLKRISRSDKSKELSFNLMQSTNPSVIPRNHKVEEVLNAATIHNNLTPAQEMIKTLKEPYKNGPGNSGYQKPPKFFDKEYKTFCGT